MAQLTADEIEAYLRRIGLYPPIRNDIESLKILHAAHVQKVPFETLDILRKKPFSLCFSGMYDKIIKRNRGGYCYELNGMFSYLLKGFNFDFVICNALLCKDDGSSIPESKHMVLVVSLKERWLIDVGYGNGFIEPLPLDNPQPQHQGHRTFRIVMNSGQYLIQKLKQNTWAILYTFKLEPSTMSDFEERDRFHQINPASLFHGKRICMISRYDESLELNGNTLRRINSSGEYETFVTEAKIPQLLEEEFGLT